MTTHPHRGLLISTKLKDICVYLDQGLVSMEQVNILFAGFVDDEADASKRKALMDNLKLLSSMKDSHGASEHTIVHVRRAQGCAGSGELTSRDG